MKGKLTTLCVLMVSFKTGSWEVKGEVNGSFRRMSDRMGEANGVIG